MDFFSCLEFGVFEELNEVELVEVTVGEVLEVLVGF
jgi:hypothetical protein